ncbi:alpha/beta hydrolase [Okeania sp.]|uniref:alpha/beta hydrolase n=1 Tax=Okeania sp. TaxID=3100323 RepID=UPI002B4B494B|nr:alpha/beta hydrolase [Okeania sp.]MEB3339806.1 alpha/beta hydrolase [Okeania sp.]
MQLSNLLSRSSLAIFGTISGVIFSSQSAIAASKVVIDITGPIQASVKVKDLRRFAETGETTKTIRQALAASKDINPKTIRGIMSLEIGADIAKLAKVLYSERGQNITKAISEVVQTRYDKESDKALRSAIILAAIDDNRISILEIMEKYPTTDMYINLAKINEIVGKVQEAIGNLEELLQ